MTESYGLDLEALGSILERHALGGRSKLLPVLFEAQGTYGYLPEPVIEEIGEKLHIPLAEIYGVIEFYTMLYEHPVGRSIVRVCTSPICAQAGGVAALETARRHLGVTSNRPDANAGYTVEEVACLGLCDHAPAALVDEIPVGGIDAVKPELWIKHPQATPLGVIGGEPRCLTSRCGEIEATDLTAFETRGGFKGLRRALLEMEPGEVTVEIKDAGLLGRGGAAFPTGLKWEYTAATESDTRYVVCNADESEPGTFKDRVLLEGDPYFVLEGMAIAAYAIGARFGYIYVRGEYPRAQRIIKEAIEIASEAGYLGENILKSGFSFDVKLRSGAGAYICGEETALFESIEGKRGYPRLKPPFPTTNGLFGEPTVINNVETLCAAAWIIANGADAFRAIGTEKSPGSKLFCLSGDIVQPGVYEVPFGTTLGDLLELAGGMRGELQAMLIGGAAGSFADPDQLDLRMDFEDLQDTGLSLGSGVIMAINQDRNLRQTLLGLAHFFSHESCGKCFPCQLGTMRQLEIISKVAEGKSNKADVVALEDIGFTMTNASLCGLGMTAATAILSAMEKWPDLFVSGR